MKVGSPHKAFAALHVTPLQVNTRTGRSSKRRSLRGGKQRRSDSESRPCSKSTLDAPSSPFLTPHSVCLTPHPLRRGVDDSPDVGESASMWGKPPVHPSLEATLQSVSHIQPSKSLNTPGKGALYY